MSEIPRLNGVIRALEEGKTAFVSFAPVDIELASSSYDSARAGSQAGGTALRHARSRRSPRFRGYGIGAPRSWSRLRPSQGWHKSRAIHGLPAGTGTTILTSCAPDLDRMAHILPWCLITGRGRGNVP